MNNAILYLGRVFFKISLLVFCVLSSNCYSVGLSYYENKTIASVAKTNLVKLNTLPSFQNGSKWESCLQRMRRDISNIGTASEAIHYAQSAGHLDFDHRGILSPAVAEAYENNLKREFPNFAYTIQEISESIYSDKESLLEHNGHLVSDILYYHYRYVLQCLTYIENPKVICEIGSGYGGPARLWMLNPISSPDIYILLDFPECLFFAENFLKANFKDDKDVDILYIDEIPTKELNRSKFPNKTIILCPIGKQSLLNSMPIDLVINTGSMQEMAEDWVDYWMKWLDEAQIRYFYSLNYFARPITQRTSECATVYAPRLSNKWHCLLNNMKRPFSPEISFPLFAEIIAAKNEAPVREIHLKEKFILVQIPLDNQGFLDCMDIVRLCPEQELIWDLVTRIFIDESGEWPQETLYLIKWLLKNGSDSFLEDKTEWLKDADAYFSAFLN